MPPSKPITTQELDEIWESVLKAWNKVRPQPQVILDWRKMVESEHKLSPDLRLQNRMLFSLRCSHKRNLLAKPIPSVIRKALAKNDIEFFIQLGRTLDTPAVVLKPSDYEEKPSRLVDFMLRHWALRTADLPELFYLDPEGLADVCSHCLQIEVSTTATFAVSGLKTA